jgi:hypothetical protein
MGLVFWRIYQSIHYHFQWFEKFRVIEELRRLSGSLNLDYVKTYYDVALKWHEHMRQEIFQTIQTCDEKTQVYMFEELIPYLSDWRIASIPYDYIEKIVNEYNEAEEKRFNEEVKKKDEEHKSKVDYTKPHMAEIPPEKKNTNLSPIFPGSILLYSHPLPTKNNYYYEYWGKPDLIDTDVLPGYYKSLEVLQQSFRDNTSLYTKLYQEGKYVPKDKIVILKETIEREGKNHETELPISPDQKLLPAPISRIKANITVKRLLYLFKALIDTNVITHPSEIKELLQMISNSFYTERAEVISIEQLQKKWSEIQQDPKLAGFWGDKFIELHNQARKDNPNKIKF